MKTCSKCNENKELELFSKNGRNADGRHPWCKVCFATYERERYQNGDSVRKQRNNKKTRGRNHKRLWAILSEASCMDCGESDPIVLEFDHRDQATKTTEICTLYHRSWANIKEELDKCDIVCCNCHRRRTTVQLGWWRGQM